MSKDNNKHTLEGDVSKAFRIIQQRQLASEAALGALTNYPLPCVVGCAILYGMDIGEQYGIVDGKNLIRSNKTASLIGVLEKIIEIDNECPNIDEHFIDDDPDA
tara:strand:- start:288 stop:599 length:312 start_codon:yes stop_codon:yes gene_type:complete